MLECQTLNSWGVAALELSMQATETAINKITLLVLVLRVLPSVIREYTCIAWTSAMPRISSIAAIQPAVSSHTQGREGTESE